MQSYTRHLQGINTDCLMIYRLFAERQDQTLLLIEDYQTSCIADEDA